jgi:predicted nucleic acid-binding protein
MISMLTWMARSLRNTLESIATPFILHRVGVIAAAQALDRIESSTRVSIVFASGAHHAAARAWLAKFTDRRFTYADAVGFAVIEDLRCIGFLSFDSDFLLAGFLPWAPA